MKYMPYHSLFFTTLVMGTLMTLSSNHWIYIWMGLEINLLSFIPLILHSDKNREVEAASKYFLVQALGSSLILLSSFSILWNPFSILSFNLTAYLLIFALMIKMGAAPFHFWLPQIMASISWMSCAILATWQKIAPLFIMASISSPLFTKMLMILASISTLTGGVGGLNQTHLRPLLAYSSIGHLGWMIAATIISIPMTLTYFFIYSLMTISIMLLANKENPSKNYISSLTNSSMPLILSLMILFLSLGGLPPLLGFLPKWMMIKTLMLQNMHLFTLIMIGGSLISLFYYLSIFFNLFLNYSLKSYSNKYIPSTLTSLSILSTITLGIPPLFILYALILLHKP